MLERLTIRNLGLITDVDLELKSGLVVITGETGAGKTLFLDAIRALAGSKPEIVNASNAESASVEATLSLTPEIQNSLAEVDAMTEEGAVTISRFFPKEGRGKSVLGGRSVPAGVLEEMSHSWLAIHGQHDSYRLMKPQTHRELLDRFGGSETLDLLAQHSANYQQWGQLKNQLAQVQKERTKLLANADEVRADLALCESLALRIGEDVEIAETIERVSRIEQVRAAVNVAENALSSDEVNVSAALTSAEKALSQALPDDTQTQSVVARLHALKLEIADVMVEISRISDSLDVDPAALDALMLRQRQIKTLLLRRGPEISDVLQWMDAAKLQLALIDPDGKALKELEDQVAKALTKARISAAALSTLRNQRSTVLGQLVATELAALAMPHAKFEIHISEADMTEFGTDRVEFKFSANPGLALQSIEKAASGGELSRLMLAIEVVLADVGPPSVMVFDEVDAGVAGAAAISVAQRLQTLSLSSQVLVVTHLAQIAAFASQHFTVSKSSDGSMTTTSISEISGESRELELARMLAGLESSHSAKQHAQELLEMAKTGF